MVNNLHIWTPVIEQLEYKNNTGNFLQSTLNNYSVYNGNAAQVYPSLVQTKKGNPANAYEPRIQFNAYDPQGNISDVSKAGGIRISYQWGYNSEYPVAQVTNAPVDNIYYDSFEEGDGNSSVGDAQTGHYSFVGYYYTRTVNIVNAGNYNLTYWLKNGGAWALQSSVTYIAPVNGQYTIYIPGQGGAQLQIDDVRLYPVGAQMVTYTYDPLIGMTGMTDAKNETTYYAYDTFNRLSMVLDKNKNIVKAYCYNYAGQQVNCNVLPKLPQPIYAVLTETNYQDIYNNGEGLYDDYTEYEAADLVVEFFSDPACTKPINLPEQQTVTLAENYTFYIYNSTGYYYSDPVTVSPVNYVLQPGASSYTIASGVPLFYASQETDDSVTTNYSTNYSYSLTLYPGSIYTIVY
jgi:hypothetical protein